MLPRIGVRSGRSQSEAEISNLPFLEPGIDDFLLLKCGMKSLAGESLTLVAVSSPPKQDL